MKFLVVIVLSLLNCRHSQAQIIDSSGIIAFNESIVQGIIDGNRTLNIDHYLTKDELLLLAKNSTDSLVQIELAEYETNLNRFSKFYSDNFKSLNLSLSHCEDINWNECSIDSAEYMIVISRPEERDTKIQWPESKSYKLGTDQMENCKGVVFISEGKKKYAISLNTIYCDGKLKFYHISQSPRIVRLI